MTPVTVLINAEDEKLSSIVGEVVKAARAKLYGKEASRLSLVGIRGWNANVRELLLLKTCLPCIYSCENLFC